MRNSRIRKQPVFKEKVYLIVEGQSEVNFIERLKLLYESKYNLNIVNAESGSKIAKKYKDIRKINREAQIFVLYDLDGNKTMESILEDYKKYSLELSIIKKNFYFVNPKIELLFVLHKEKRALTIVSDSDYQKLIKKHYGIDNYDKELKQIKKIINSIDYDDFEEIINQIKKLKISKNQKNIPSTNFDELFSKIFDKR